MSSVVQELQGALSELQAMRTSARSTRVKAVLDREIMTVDAELTSAVTAQMQAAAAAAAPVASMDVDSPPPAAVTLPLPSAVAISPSGGVKVPKEITKYGWDQSSKFVKVYLDIKDGGPGLALEHCKLQVNPTSFGLLVECPNGKAYRLAIGQLGGEVTQEGSSLKVKPDGSITVALKKAKPADWAALKKEAESSKIKPPKTDKSEDPQASIMSLMKEMYDGGDDEMKKTISKAFYESQNGKGPSDPMSDLSMDM